MPHTKRFTRGRLAKWCPELERSHQAGRTKRANSTRIQRQRQRQSTTCASDPTPCTSTRQHQHGRCACNSIRVFSISGCGRPVAGAQPTTTSNHQQSCHSISTWPPSNQQQARQCTIGTQQGTTATVRTTTKAPSPATEGVSATCCRGVRGAGHTI